MIVEEIENDFINETMLQINRVASKDYKTNDPQYNRGLIAIQKFGYEHVVGNPDVEYWRKCNNL